MDSLNNNIREYKIQLRKGQIQEAYKGIMTFMSGLSTYLGINYPDYTTSALYFGYMDMSYFACTPPDLKIRKLKIAIVYLHEKGIFEVWLAGNNRKIQAEYIDLMSYKNIGKYKVSQLLPGEDSIIKSIVVENPDFDHPEDLRKQIEANMIEFVKGITSILDEFQKA